MSVSYIRLQIMKPVRTNVSQTIAPPKSRRQSHQRVVQHSPALLAVVFSMSFLRPRRGLELWGLQKCKQYIHRTTSGMCVLTFHGEEKSYVLYVGWVRASLCQLSI